MVILADHIQFLRKGFGQASTLIFCLMCFLPSYDASAFSYISKMEDLLVIQRHVIVCANRHISLFTSPAKKRTLQRHIKPWQEEHIKAMVNTTRYLENPINAYTLLRRLAQDLNNIEKILNWNQFKEYKRKRKLVYPSDHDMKGANAVFLNLVIIYNLNITELANGTLRSTFNKGNKPFIEYVSPMTASDCYELAQAALKFKDYKFAVAWAQKAFHKYPQDCIEICYYTEWDIIEFITGLYTTLGEYQKSLHWLEKSNKEKLTPFLLHKYESKIQLLTNKIKTQKYPWKVWKNLTEHPLEAAWKGKSKNLCFAERINTSKNLTCQYKFGPDPFLRLARLKAETLHLEPEITMFHDVISDDEISAVQKLSEEKFQSESEVQGEYDTEAETVHKTCLGLMSIRHSMRHMACLWDLGSPLTAIYRRATDISGCDKAIPSEVYVGNYGVAGYHNPHFDNGDMRILDETHEGGATIFTKLNLTVFPKKNCALYFKNRLPSGEMDDRLEHASCPVLYGSKWILLRWITDYIISREASQNKQDVESGLPANGDTEARDTLRPLLGVGSPSINAPRPPRPLHLGPFSAAQNSAWRLYTPSDNQDDTPSAESTANNTPISELPELWPKKWRRSDRRLRRLNTELLEAIEGHDVEEVERLLNSGANPNATCRLDLVSACHFAALIGGDSLGLLLKFGAEKHRLDKLGRTPLHLAACAGNARQTAMLLGFPEDMHDRLDSENLSPEAEEDVKKLCPKTRDLANLRCDVGEVHMILPKNWKDNIDHNCKNITGSIPLIQPGWTPLHVAASCSRPKCTRLLLASGADPNICDEDGRTPLDVAGSAIYFDCFVNPECLTKVIKMLLTAGGSFNTMKATGLNHVNTPLHTAVELESLDIINELLNAGACVSCLNLNGQTPLHVCVKKELEEPLQILANFNTNDADLLTAIVDVKDRDGHTVLQAAVEAAWVPGVCIALEAGADVTMKANDGETPIHSAAALGNVDVLNEILSITKQKEVIDFQNESGETPLFKAILNGHLECMQALLNEGASLKITLPGNVNVFHAAAEHGCTEILKELLEYNEDVTMVMIDSLTAADKRGLGPIHFAVFHDHPECVKLLLSKNADVRLRTTDSPGRKSTPLHVAAFKNHTEIAKIILRHDKTTIHEVNSLGWYPLHTAGHHGSRDAIQLLLKEGADLSRYSDGSKKFRRTAIDMIINNLSKPTDFLEEVFDSYIQSNSLNLQDPNCEITVNYRILMPSGCEIEQMKVIQALIKTGNHYQQRRLLVHPLIESFLYLKWKALLPFFYTIIIMYSLFVASLTIFTVSVFFFKDTNSEKPAWLASDIWGYMVYVTIFLLLGQELLYMNVTSRRYFCQTETWVKFGSIGLATMLPAIVTITNWYNSEWPRHVATIALLLSWTELMFLLSRFPNWGYYVLMFGKVASNVIKILLTFAFLVIGFSLSFMIQFKSQVPFEGPWAALVKTVVMMTSEFEYEGLFDEEHMKEFQTSMIIIRIIFFIFVILASIVLMNLLVGVAVNDINDLEILGNIRRLVKQVEFLGTLDTLVYNKFFNFILPKRVNNGIKNKRSVVQVLTLCPGKPRWRHYFFLSSKLRDAIFELAVCKKKQVEDKEGFQVIKKQLEDMHNILVKRKEERDIKTKIAKEMERPLKDKMRHDEIMKHLSDIDIGMAHMKEQMITYTKEYKCPIEELNVKIDQMSLEIENVKQFLSRLESKLGALEK